VALVDPRSFAGILLASKIIPPQATLFSQLSHSREPRDRGRLAVERFLSVFGTLLLIIWLVQVMFPILPESSLIACVLFTLCFFSGLRDFTHVFEATLISV